MGHYQCRQKLAKQVELGHLSADDIDIQMIKTQLELADLPSVDMLIRTGGEYRISNFLLWQTAYAELFLRPHYGLNLAVMSLMR